MGKNNAKLPELTMLYQAGINPKTGLPLKVGSNPCTLKDDIKKAKDERDFKTWHELIGKKIRFGEFVNKYKEDMNNGKKEKE